MKRETLENIWIVIVMIMVSVMCLIGGIVMFSENPILNIKYIFLVMLVGTPINMIMMFFTCKAKS
jgi:hypothetical protein